MNQDDLALVLFAYVESCRPHQFTSVDVELHQVTSVWLELASVRICLTTLVHHKFKESRIMLRHTSAAIAAIVCINITIGAMRLKQQHARAGNNTNEKSKRAQSVAPVESPPLR